MSNNDETVQTDLVHQLKSAYRKFKTHTYYDNYGAINRSKIANFETYNSLNENDNFFEKFAADLSDERERKRLFRRLKRKIDVLCYPKSIKSKTEDKSTLGNIPEDSDEVEKLNYFIDLDVESHILGTLWILRSGWILDHRLHKNCHGNRINQEVLKKIESFESEGKKYSELTPFLFEPYFKRYQVWRDKGLDTVEKLLEKKENAIMLSLDFKEYYYTSTINFEKIKKDIDIAKSKLIESYNDDSDLFEKELDEFLLKYIETIFKLYTKKFTRKNCDDPNLPMIPIGFLPSLIISNWNLQAFDQAILDIINPAYYGRYVDDMLIVFKSHPESESFSDDQLDVTVEEIIRKYFIPHVPAENEIENDNETVDYHNILKIVPNDGKKSTIYGVVSRCEKEFRYKINQKDAKHNQISIYDNLVIQSNKLKIFRFSHTNSRALIENFKKEIYRNSSEFRLMHTSEKLYADVGKNIFSIQYAESINKLGDIESIRLNKFELSKTLSWLIRTSIYETDPSSGKNLKNIIHAFSGSKKIEYMILWEKFIEFLFIQKKYDTLKEQIEETINKISYITFKGNKDASYTYNHDSEVLLKKTLLKFLYFTFARVISLRRDSNEDIGKICEKLEIELVKNIINDYDESLPKKFLISYLYKNSLMKDPLCYIEGIPDIDFSKENYDLIKGSYTEIHNSDTYMYYPRYIQFHETTFHKISNLLANNKKLDVINYLKSARRLYYAVNGFEKSAMKNQKGLFYKIGCGASPKDCPCEFEDNKIGSIIKTDFKKKSTVNIGLINTQINKNHFYEALKGDPNRSSKRLDKIADIINQAIIKGVELLVMPEMYIPYEWVPGILDISRTHNIAMVFGIEPIINKNNVGNYIGIALPTEKNEHNNCTFVMRLKNRYSPEELKEYRANGLKYISNKPTNYILCVWNEIYFVPYYCYEIANIKDRALFKGCCDLVIVSELNRDTNYFNAIAESLSRDLFCYCIKANSSEFGGTCILQPSKSEVKYLINLKGGQEDYVVTQTLDIEKLRKSQIRNYESDTINELKPKPPGFEDYKIRARMKLPPR